MFKLSLVAVAAAAVLTSTGAFAQTSNEGGNIPPTVVICYGKTNAGVGNNAELGRTELRDCDPGKSGLHNQAGKNSDKPQSKNNR